jgi:type II secretory pathway pseudopilin PulG
MKNIYSQKGFLIIEVLVAIVIFSLVSLSLFSSISFAFIRTERTRYGGQAALLAQEAIEATYNIFLTENALADGNYKLVQVADNDKMRWSAQTATSESLQTRFTRVIQITSVCRNSSGDQTTCSGTNTDENTKKVKTTITWDESGQEKTFEAELLVLTLDQDE